MYQRKKINKWLVGIFGFVTATAIFLLFVLLYTHQFENQLLAYARSLANLPEVEEVLAVSEFTGSKRYIVARVRLIGGEEHMYFVHDDVVATQIPVTELIEVESVMMEVFGTTDIVRYSLGRHGGDIVYELVANTPEGVNYVVANALSGQVVMSFILE